MLRILALALWFMPAVFLASPLTADDLYGAPDPGWYNQGSGWSPERARDPVYDAPGYRQGYGQDYATPDYGRTDSWWGADRDGASVSRYRDDHSREYQRYSPDSAGGYDASGRDWYGYDAPGVRDEPRLREDAPEAISPNGYGAPDWAQEPLPQRRRTEARPAPYYDPDYRADDAWSAPPDAYADERSPWRAPPSRPRYRFRDDPDLQQGIGGRGPGGYEFRPLTPREQQRQRSADDDAFYSDSYRGQRYRPRNQGDRGTAFGYAPGPAQPDDFYERYYRSGP
jgi:hypothetical protein